MKRIREGLGVVKPLGWALLVLAVVGWLVTTQLHWQEVAVLTVAALVLLVLALPFLLGRTHVDVQLTLQPERVAAGDSVAAGVVVTNRASSRLVPTTLEVPVGAATHRYRIGSLAAAASHEESFTIRTERRGVIEVGPAVTRRGDPVGLFSRDMVWTPVREILVRPPLLPMDELGAGLLRDLEGVATDAVSQSDLAFHALREYVPGDDLRHIHWRSSAKAMAAGADSDLLVRQYLDTRRSHATIVVDDRSASWSDEDAFETAMSVAASIAVRAVLDEFDVSYVCGPHASSGGDGHLALDAVCRSQFGKHGVIEAAHRASRVASDTSLLFLVGGAGTEFTDLLRGSAAFPPEVRRIGIVVDAGGTSRVTETGGLPVLHLADSHDLGGLLQWSMR
jgi:hypothetical protein